MNAALKIFEAEQDKQTNKQTRKKETACQTQLRLCHLYFE